MSLLATTVATAIAAASAAAAVASFFAYLHYASRSEAHAARDEALALAETRRETITDLRRRVSTLEARARELEEGLSSAQAEAREHAYQMQRFYASSLADLLRDVRADLEETPPNVARPLARIRELLDERRLVS
jgi:uncharacterized protein YlxW (UPF0749 family)